MRNLSWYKGNKKIVDGASHEIDNEENKFVLTIHKLSLNDAGDYVCSGFDMIMGHQFNNTVHLYVKASSKNRKCFIEVEIDMKLRHHDADFCASIRHWSDALDFSLDSSRQNPPISSIVECMAKRSRLSLDFMPFYPLQMCKL